MAFDVGRGKVDVRVNYIGREVFDHFQRLVYHLETKANWLMGICSVIIVMIVTRYDAITLNNLSSIGEFIILGGCLIAIINLMFILVPRLTPSRNHAAALKQINIHEYRNILQHFGKGDFANHLDKLTHDEEELHKAYATSIYQIAALRLPSYSKKLSFAGWTIIFSLLLGTVLIVTSYLVNL